MAFTKKKIQLPEDTSIVAKCYLSDPADERKISIITPFWIYFVSGSKIWRIEHDNVLNISTGHHKLMGPLIIGSLTACFSAILLSRNTFDPFLLLIALIGGLIASYYGWMGAETITISEKNDATNIYLSKLPSALESYLIFYKSYLRTSDKAMSLYHIAKKPDYENGNDQYDHPSLLTEKFIHASTREQVLPTFSKHFPEDGDFILLQIDMKKLSSEVRFEYVSERSELFPHIYGTIDKSAVTATYPFANQNELREILLKI